MSELITLGVARSLAPYAGLTRDGSAALAPPGALFGPSGLVLPIRFEVEPGPVIKGDA